MITTLYVPTLPGWMRRKLTIEQQHAADRYLWVRLDDAGIVLSLGGQPITLCDRMGLSWPYMQTLARFAAREIDKGRTPRAIGLQMLANAALVPLHRQDPLASETWIALHQRTLAAFFPDSSF